ncbi:MAG: dTDP-6-deoxy-L-hexose 3-O-methyltransferase [bacterium]|nr:dTDP-6-deoxy-L-hexose 3-O-methyltransferase [bacterium]
MSEKASWQSYDEFLTTGTMDRYTKLWARYEFFKMVLELPGDIVECGVFQGTGALYWARMIELFNPTSRRKVIGFDTFEGYPETMKGEQDKKTSQDFISVTEYKGCTPDEIMGKAAKLGLEHRIELVKGDAVKTIKGYVEKNPGFRAALLNLDFDIHEPTMAALENIYPRIVPQGIVVFDEYAVHEWEESNAADLYFKGKNVVYKTLPWAFSPTAYLVKPTL